MFRTLKRHEEDGLGLPYPVVLVDSAEEEVDDATGEVVGISIPDMEKLVAAVAVARVMNPLQLDGAEVRFLRHAIGMSGAAFAEALNLDAATLSRWENGKQSVGEWADKQVRSYALLALRDNAPGFPADASAFISMRVLPREPGQWPTIELRRRDLPPREARDPTGWAPPRAA